MDQLESVGTTPSHIAVSDRAYAHRSSSDNPKSGRRARHGVSTTGCPSIVDLFPYTLDLGSNPIRPEPFTWTGSQLTDPQTWPRAPRHSAGPGLRTGASAHTTASSSDLRRRSALSSTRVRSGDTFTDPSGRRIHPWRLMSFAQEVSATAVPPVRCR